MGLFFLSLEGSRWLVVALLLAAVNEAVSGSTASQGNCVLTETQENSALLQ